jgi:hypothetical protein
MAVPCLVLDTNTGSFCITVTKAGLPCLPRVPLDPADFTRNDGELMRALAYPKFKLTPTEREELLGDYLPYCDLEDK